MARTRCREHFSAVLGGGSLHLVCLRPTSADGKNERGCRHVPHFRQGPGSSWPTSRRRKRLFFEKSLSRASRKERKPPPIGSAHQGIALCANWGHGIRGKQLAACGATDGVIGASVAEQGLQDTCCWCWCWVPFRGGSAAAAGFSGLQLQQQLQHHLRPSREATVVVSAPFFFLWLRSLVSARSAWPPIRPLASFSAACLPGIVVIAMLCVDSCIWLA